jgi:hypothetical protein
MIRTSTSGLWMKRCSFQLGLICVGSVGRVRARCACVGRVAWVCLRGCGWDAVGGLLLACGEHGHGRV